MNKKVADREKAKRELLGDPPAGRRKAPAKKATGAKRGRKPKVVEKPEMPPDPSMLTTSSGGSIHPYPPNLADPTMGIKTPAVREWYLKNHPEDAAKLGFTA